MKHLLLVVILSAAALHAQNPLEGVWKGYDGEWLHVSRQLVELAEAIPADKYSWRPADGVRSVSEVIMHIAITNYGLLEFTGPKFPADLDGNHGEKTITSKDQAVAWLKKSLDAVKTAHAAVKPADLRRPVKINGVDSNVDDMYLRIIVHANEHMGQLVAYARMNGIAPPWSK